jgi:hypothetical protein
MTTPATTPGEHVAKVIEICERKVVRVFYCIYDPEFDQWMSEEPFDGLIWTRDARRRREFDTREEAEAEWCEFLDWRESREDDGDLTSEIPWEDDAA